MKEKITILNPMATSYVRKGDKRDLDIESKKELSDMLIKSKCAKDKCLIPKQQNKTKINSAFIDTKRTRKEDANMESNKKRCAKIHMAFFRR